MRATWRDDALLAQRIELPGGSQAPGEARQTLTALLATRLDASDLFEVTVLISDDVLRIEVCDRGPGFIPPAAPAPRPEGGGNGLVLLASLSTSWGVAPADGGTCVWFERELARAS